MLLLKQDTPFVWDETTQLAFKALKKALLLDPLLRPPDYSKDFILYLAASELTIGVVLVHHDHWQWYWLGKSAKLFKSPSFLYFMAMLGQRTRKYYCQN